MLAKIDNPTIIPVSIEKNLLTKFVFIFSFSDQESHKDKNIHPSNMKNLFVYLRKK